MKKGYFVMIVAALYISLTIAMLAGGPALQAASIRYGSTNTAMVRAIQTKLKNWGYYDGAVDGDFKGATLTAVRAFQSKNGLTPDGIVGAATAAKMGIQLSGSAPNVSDSNYGGQSGGQTDTSSDVYLMARCIYGEARGEPYIGQVAVGAVILNRVRHAEFPNSIAGVIYQPRAFSVVADGQINLAPDDTALRAARDAMNGWDPTGGAIVYFNPAKTSNAYVWSRPEIVTIGSHRFCR